MLLDENELFIFDWDGTLATSGALIRVSKMLKARYKLGYILKHKERYKVRSVNDLVIKEEKGKLVSTIYALYAKLYPVRLKPGSEELLKLLKKNRKRVCIFSDSNTTRLMAEARSTNMVKYVDFILSSDAIDRYKPDPSVISSSEISWHFISSVGSALLTSLYYFTTFIYVMIYKRIVILGVAFFWPFSCAGHLACQLCLRIDNPALHPLSTAEDQDRQLLRMP